MASMEEQPPFPPLRRRAARAVACSSALILSFLLFAHSGVSPNAIRGAWSVPRGAYTFMPGGSGSCKSSKSRASSLKLTTPSQHFLRGRSATSRGGNTQRSLSPRDVAPQGKKEDDEDEADPITRFFTNIFGSSCISLDRSSWSIDDRWKL